MMNKKQKPIILTLGGLITTFVVYITVRMVTGDTEYIVPGWHTTIYPPPVTWIVLKY